MRPVASYLSPQAAAEPTRDLPAPARALAIGAHPDDIDFGCGATLAKWAAAGTEIVELVLTDGSKGSWDPAVEQSALVVTRQAEQRDAARALGAKDVVFLGWVDGELESGHAQREAVCRVIREVRPDVVLGHDPWKLYRLHPDHRHAGTLAVEGIVAARDPHFFRAQALPPHRPAHLLLWEAEIVDHTENVADYLDTKVEALLCHRSQWESTMAISDDDAPASPQRAAFVARVRERAAEAGGPAGLEAAEAFKRIDRL